MIKNNDTTINELKLGNDSPMTMANCVNDYFSIGDEIGDFCHGHTQKLNFGRYASDNLNTVELNLLNTFFNCKPSQCDKNPAKLLLF